MKNKILLILFVAITFVSCGGGFMSNKRVDVKETQKPTLLVLPSDQLLYSNSSLTKIENLGKQSQVRNYNSFLLKDENSKSIIASIQGGFIDFGYPLTDLEQTLKSINDKNMIDEVSSVKKDPKTLLLTTVKPDIIIEYDYSINIDNSTREYNKTISYTLRAIDSYTNKVIATLQSEGMSLKNNKSIADCVSNNIKRSSKKFTEQIDNFFNDIVNNGRDITVRVLIDKNESFVLSGESIYGITYTDYIIDYMKSHTVMGAYKMQLNTDSELFFVNVRIKTLAEDGTQYSAYDFARDMSNTLNKECGVKSRNNTQGLGDASIIIKGM